MDLPAGSGCMTAAGACKAQVSFLERGEADPSLRSG